MAGGLDGLVNKAAIFDPQSIPDTTAAAFDRHMQINQLGCFLGIKLTRATSPERKSRWTAASVSGRQMLASN
jgi:3alpha(or 20beta)-hydroxysteroid dehydrogenase